MISASSMLETGHPKPVLWDNPDERVRREVGGGFRVGETHVYP